MLRIFLAALGALFFNLASASAEPARMGPDGLHLQPWFGSSSGDLRRDLADAAQRGKGLIVIFEQKGCGYCALMHQENFAREELVTLMTGHFDVLQLDLWGTDPIIGLDGATLTEGELAASWGVATTPVSLFLRASDPAPETIFEAQLFRMPGYLPPFQHFALIDYFATEAYQKHRLRDYITAKAEEFAARGIDPATW